MIRISRDKVPEPVTPQQARDSLSSVFQNHCRVLGIGSPRASLEANYALRCLVGTDNFYHGITRKEQILVKTVLELMRGGDFRIPSLKEMEKSDAMLILGEDLTHTAPMAALSVRQAIRNLTKTHAATQDIPDWHSYAVQESGGELRSPLFLAVPYSTKLDQLGEVMYLTPQQIADLGFAIASEIDPSAPKVKKLRSDIQSWAVRIARALAAAERPLIITGTHSGSSDFLFAASNIAKALHSKGKQADVSFMLSECNSLGLGMMEGKSLEDALERLSAGQADHAIILENDLYRRVNATQIDTFFNHCSQVVVVDQVENETTRRADILLPAGSFAESEGTLVNQEGRAQRYYRVLPAEASVIESWRQIRDILQLAGDEKALLWQQFDQVVRDMAHDLPVFQAILDYLPQADFRILNEKIKRQTIRYSGRTAIHAGVAVSETKPPDDFDSPLNFSMEGASEKLPASLVSYYWVPGWNSYQAVNFYLDAPNGSMKGGDPGIRLISAQTGSQTAYFIPPQATSRPAPGDWLTVAVHQIFGTEELSAYSPAIAGRIPEPFLLLNEKEARKVGAEAGKFCEYSLNGISMQVVIRIENTLPEGMAGISYGFPGMPYAELPAWGRLLRIQ